MFTRLSSRLACHAVGMMMFVAAPAIMAQAAGNCSEISNDVRVAVEKDPSKVLMVVEDALVISEGCAGDIVKSAILASKADATLANQIVQTATSVAPKQVVAINDAASSVVPGFVASAPAAPGSYPIPSEERPATVASGKNPGKEPIEPVAPPPVEEEFFVPSTIRGIFLIQPPASGPLPPPPTTTIPVSPSSAA